MASGPISSCQTDEEIMETVTGYFGGLQITEDGDCSHKIKTLTPWNKRYDQPGEHIKKQRYYFTKKQSI